MSAVTAAVTHAAERDELPLLWPSVAAAHLFADMPSFERWWSGAPWRVRVSGPGDAVLLGRWREHLPYASVLGVWCPRRRLTRLMAEMIDVCVEHGLERLVGPLVPEEEIAPYRDAGFTELQRIVVCRRALAPAAGVRQASGAVPGVRLRAGGPADEPAVLAVDSASFDDFWRYDDVTLRALMDTGDLTVADEDGRVIGYTLWVHHGAEGTVARLAVGAADRRRGVGIALLREAVASLARAGARAVTLTTQEENGPARRLYEHEGFRESPRRLVCTISLPRGEDRDGAGRE